MLLLDQDRHLHVRRRLAWIPIMVTIMAVMTRGDGDASLPVGADVLFTLYSDMLALSWGSTGISYVISTFPTCTCVCSTKGPSLAMSDTFLFWAGLVLGSKLEFGGIDRCRFGLVKVDIGLRRPLRMRRLLISLHWFAGISRKKLLGFLGNSQHRISVPEEERVIRYRSLEGGNREYSIHVYVCLSER